MLPFLNSKKITSIIMARKDKPDLHDAKSEVSMGDKESDAGMESAAQDILSAIDSRSVKDLANALRSAFSLLDNDECDEPSLEGEE